MTDSIQLQVSSLPQDQSIRVYDNLVYISPNDMRRISQGNNQDYVLINEKIPFIAEASTIARPGTLVMSKIQRDGGMIDVDAVLNVRRFVPAYSAEIVGITLSVEVKKDLGDKKFSIDSEECTKVIKECFGGQPFVIGQKLVMQFFGETLLFQVLDIITVSQVSTGQSSGQTAQSFKPQSRTSIGTLSKRTVAATYKTTRRNNVQILSQEDQVNTSVFKENVDFSKLGIGGLDNELQTIFRKAFGSRIIPPKLRKELNINHVRGMMLFGPPGTGKTTIAREIGRALNSREPIIKSGPEMLNKFVGEGERQVRELFTAAEEEQKREGENSLLHIIIIDEIDAICKERGSNSAAGGSGDSIVNQLLAKIDGVDSLDNILMIGMTNRLDMIDRALRRPGRFEIEMEIGLPDEAGRREILKIKTKSMAEAKRLSPDVSIPSLASLMKNYSGAEIEGVVRAAASFAFAKQIDFQNLGKGVSQEDLQKLQVTNENFVRAIDEVRPIFGRDDKALKPGDFPFLEYSTSFSALLKQLRLVVRQVRGDPNSQIQAEIQSGSPEGGASSTNLGGGITKSSLLISGKPLTGKSSVASLIIREANFPFVRLLGPRNFVGKMDSTKIHVVEQVFNDASKCEMSCIILEDIDRIMEYVAVGSRFNNTMYHGLKALISVQPTPGKNLLIVATTSCPDFIEEFDLDTVFDNRFHIPELSSKEDKANVLRQQTGFSEDPVAVQKCVDMMQDDIAVKRLILDAKFCKVKADVENMSLDTAFSENLMYKNAK